MMRTFELHRAEDMTGVSGTGIVAEGAVFDDGAVALRWIVGEHRSTVSWASIEAVIAVHGHDGRTRVVWTDLADPTVTPLACGCTAVRTPGPDMGATSSAHSNSLVEHRPADPMFAGLLDHLEKAIVEGALPTDARCRSCKAPVAWRNSHGGKRMPLDPVPSDNGNVLVSGGYCGVLKADQIANARGAGEPLYTSHFATCPDADAWRSKGGDRG